MKPLTKPPFPGTASMAAVEQPPVTSANDPVVPAPGAKPVQKSPINGVNDPTPSEIAAYKAIEAACHVAKTPQARAKAVFNAASAALEHMSKQFSFPRTRSDATWYVISEKCCENRGFQILTVNQMLDGHEQYLDKIDGFFDDIRAGRPLIQTRQPYGNTAYRSISAQSAAGFIKGCRSIFANVKTGEGPARDAVAEAVNLAVDIVVRRTGATKADIDSGLMTLIRPELRPNGPAFVLTHSGVETNGEFATRRELIDFTKRVRQLARPQLREWLATHSALDQTPQRWRASVEIVGEHGPLHSAAVLGAEAALEDCLAARRGQDVKAGVMRELEDLGDTLDHGTAEQKSAAAAKASSLLSGARFHGPLSEEQGVRLQAVRAKMATVAREAFETRYGSAYDVVSSVSPAGGESSRDFVARVGKTIKRHNVKTALVNGKVYAIFSGDSEENVVKRLKDPSSAALNAAVDVFHQFDSRARELVTASEFAAASAKASSSDRVSLRVMPMGLALTTLKDAGSIRAYGEEIERRGPLPSDIEPLWTALRPNAEWPVDEGARPAWLLVLERLTRLQRVPGVRAY